MWVGLLLLLSTTGLAARQDREEPARQSQGATTEAQPADTTGDFQRFRASRTRGEIDVDARLEEPAWEDATEIRLPYEWLPGDNTPAPVETICRVTYDLENLYVGCLASDPRPSEIRAHLADRDTPFGDDHLVVLLDTFNDQRRAYQFRVNPFGVQMDAILSTESEDFSWDAIWNSAGRITDDGYVVEVAIPFESLSFQSTSGPQTWGIILGRSYPRSVRHRLRSTRTDRDETCLLCQSDRIAGFRGVQPGTPVELNPTLTTSRTDARPGVEAAMETGDLEWEPGLNARWRVTPNLSLDATANPDFSQVEADVAQLEVNTRFALSFPEKRPFFLEGADFFQMPANLVFTRTVVDPIAGLKTTGKVGANAVGAFAAVDDAPSVIIPGPQRSSAPIALEDEVLTGVTRYRRDLGTNSYVGGLVTVREGAGYHNRLLAADADIRLSSTTSLMGLLGGTDTEYPRDLAADFGQPTSAFGGWGYTAAFRHRSRHWFVGADWSHVDSHLRADAGFIPQVGFRGPSVELGYTFWGEADHWFNRIGPRVEFSRTVNEETGELLDQEVEIATTYQGPLQTFANLEVNLQRERFAGRTFDLVRPVAAFEVRPTGDVSLDLFTVVGDAIDFANVREASRFRIDPGAELRLGSHVELRLDHTLERLSRDGRRIFTANLSQARVKYHFSRRALLRTILQYRKVDRNPGMFDDPVREQDEALFTQLLFSYEVNPRTVLFAGYSDDRDGFRRETREVDLTQTSRSFFLKLGYAWRP